jgi:hypothetical protein
VEPANHPPECRMMGTDARAQAASESARNPARATAWRPRPEGCHPAVAGPDWGSVFAGTVQHPQHSFQGQTGLVDGTADTPGSVLPRRCRQGSGGHPSTSAVADALQRPTRALRRAALKRALSGLAPGGVYLAFPVTREAGGLLHHRFTLTCFVPLSNRRDPGGLFSVALACGLPRVGVTHHPALWSPDVPRATCVTRTRTRRTTGRQLRPSYPVAHEVTRLVLLPPGPDTVHGV